MPINRTVLITGANQGMGKQVAKELVSDGVALLFNCRIVAQAVAGRPHCSAGSPA